MQKKISIIIPIYNGEKYIERCVESVLNQKNFYRDNLDVLLLNDGSKDESLVIANKYQTRYPSVVRVVNQVNIGAAKTRNKGIALAAGLYLMLIDQDDYIDPDYCQTFYDAISSIKSDVVQGGFKLVNRTGMVVKEQLPVETDFGKFLAIPAWGKIYRTDFLRDNDITFFDNNIGEDSVFTTKVILKSGSYHTIAYAGYCNSFDNDTNVTNTLHKGLSKSVNIIGLLEELLKITGTDKKQAEILDYNIIRTASYYLLSYGRYATIQRFYETYEDLFAWFGKHMPQLYRNKYIWLRPKGEHVSAHLGIAILMVVYKLRLTRVFAIIYCKRGSNE